MESAFLRCRLLNCVYRSADDIPDLNVEIQRSSLTTEEKQKLLTYALKIGYRNREEEGEKSGYKVVITDFTPKYCCGTEMSPCGSLDKLDVKAMSYLFMCSLLCALSTFRIMQKEFVILYKIVDTDDFKFKLVDDNYIERFFYYLSHGTKIKDISKKRSEMKKFMDHVMTRFKFEISHHYENAEYGTWASSMQLQNNIENVPQPEPILMKSNDFNERLLRRVATGTFSAIFNTSDDNVVAKYIYSDDESTEEEFVNKLREEAKYHLIASRNGFGPNIKENTKWFKISVEKTKGCIEMEKYDHDLFHLLNENFDTLNRADVMDIEKQLHHVLQSMLRSGMSCWDIKPENFLYKKPKSEAAAKVRGGPKSEAAAKVRSGPKSEAAAKVRGGNDYDEFADCTEAVRALGDNRVWDDCCEEKGC